MGFDLVTWSPRVGSTGDDQYNLPGATKIDGSLDTGNPTRIDVGDASGFSTIPTIAEINASSGLNQIVGLVNRRRGNANALLGTAFAALPYFTPGAKITYTNIAALQSGVIATRTIDSLEVYPVGLWPAYSTGKPIAGNLIAHFRKALRISGKYFGTSRYTYGLREVFYGRRDSPWGTPYSETVSPPQSYMAGKYFLPVGSQQWRMRILYAQALPEWVVSTEGSAIVHFTPSSYNNALEAGWTLDAYLSDSDDHAWTIGSYTGWPYNTDTLLASFAYSTLSRQTASVSMSTLAARAGTWLSLVFGNSYEIAGTGAAPTVAYTNATVSESAPYGIEIDYGT
jgi:hypothetical protein